ncbi:hypothetical protein GQ457_11G028180 [Hibiscus cannabinus]
MANNSLGVNISQPVIPVFQGNNYGVWSTKMKTLFISQDLWELVEKGYSEEGVTVEALRDYKKKDAKALFFIQQAVDDAIFSSQISAATKAKEAWDALKNGYQGTTRVLTVKLQTLRKQFESFRMKEGESIHDCSNNLMVIVNQMRTYGEQITDQKVVEKLLRSLTRKYESIVSAIEESKDLTVLTIDELLGSLQSHEDRHKSYEENEKAFQAKLKFPKENTTGHERSGNYIRGGYSYRGRRSGGGGGKSSDRQQRLVDGSQTPNYVWYMDSGSSSHMTANLEAFISLNSADDGEGKVDAQLYRSLVGSLLYLTISRPDILQATSLLSRFMQSPSKVHYGAAKRVLRYLKETCSYGLWYSNSGNFKLLGFSDSDWAGSVDDRKSTIGYLFMLGSNVISWFSKKQPSTALSSSEAEYMAITSAACQAVWLRRILADMKQHQKEATTIFCDN